MIGPVDVRVFEDWQRASFDVYVFPKGELREGATGAARVWRFRAGEGYATALDYHGGQWTLEDVGDPMPFNGRPVPSFTMPTDVATAMLAFVAKAKPGVDREDAVSDARATRDRLLTLVEAVVNDGVSRPKGSVINA